MLNNLFTWNRRSNVDTPIMRISMNSGEDFDIRSE